MNTPISILPALVFSLLLANTAGGQEKASKPTPKKPEERKEGLTSLKDRIQNFGFLDYARKLADKLDGRSRKVDPFGMAMDPEEDVPEIVYDPGPDVEEGPKTTLQQAVSKFRVTGVNPARNEVIVGAQTLRQGDHVVIQHGDVSFHLKIKKIAAQSIELVDVETGEVAGTALGIVQDLPAGMTREQPPRSQSAEDPEVGGRIVPMSRRYLTLDFDSEETREQKINQINNNP